MKMPKSLWITLIVLLAAIGAPAAHADTLVPGWFHFTVTGGNFSDAPGGSFVYDATTNLFVDNGGLDFFGIGWHGVGFDFTPCANGFGVGEGTTECGIISHPQISFQALSSCAITGTNNCVWGANVSNTFSLDTFFQLAVGPWNLSDANLLGPPPGNEGDNAGGTFTTTIPEPGALLLLGSGLLGLVGFFHRKFRTPAVA